MRDWWLFVSQRWALIVADFRREYHMDADELAAISVPDFHMLVAGLSHRSRFAQAWADAPKNVYDPAAIEAIKAAARR